MLLSPYLFFNGQCEAAFKFYEQCLGGKIVMMVRNCEVPTADQSPTESQNAIMHTRLVVGDMALMGSDAPSDRYEKPQGFAVSFVVAELSDAERIFHALAENGTIIMPMEQTFWAVRFGMCMDQFGISWMISCEKAA